MQIGIRVDASELMGLGHVKRCLSLAHALREAGATVTFVCRALGLDIEGLLRGTPFALHLLPKPTVGATTSQAPHAAWAEVPQADDAAQTAAALRDTGVAWVVVDHYAFDAGWHREVARQLGARIAVIDDLADRSLAADLVIDHNLARDPATKYSKQVDPGRQTRQLIGPPYALLGPGYAAAAHYSFHDTVRSLGIFLGGTDSARLTTNALRACREEAGFLGPIEVVSTTANPHLDELRAECRRWPGTRLSVDLPDLAAFFARHDLHIGAGGGATWERCCMGAPTLGLVAAENQRVVLPMLAEVGAVAWVDDNRPSAIAQALVPLLEDPAYRRTLSQRARALVDGRGAQRVALHLLAPSLSLRPATQADARRLHDWRNDERTRAVSLDPDPIDFAAHCHWLDAVLKAPDRRLWVGKVGGVPVGAIRFDQNDPGHFTVSLYLDPALHGLGLGGHLLRSGEAALLAEAGDSPVVVHADVVHANTASHRLFEAARYAHQDNRYHKCLSAAKNNMTEQTLPRKVAS